MKEATRNRTETVVQGSYDLSGEFSRLTIVSFGALGAIIGAWALTSLASGIVAVGGPVGLAAGWVKAVFG